MKKLFSSLNGQMGYFDGQSVTGGISYALVEENHPDVLLAKSRKMIQSLDFVFPDEAQNKRYRQIYNNCENAVTAAEIYLAELGQPAQVKNLEQPKTTQTGAKAKTK